jgi:NADPH:quinone reductase-like Zn-dependent oxidoreductase
VQFAKWKGAHVIGTASARHVEFVRQLGANEVIDYQKQKFVEAVKDVDVVFDTIGGGTQERSFKVLKRGGILVSVVQPPSEETARVQGVRAVFMICDHRRNDELASIGEMVVGGQIKVHVHTVLPLNEAPQAHELSQSGHVQGKIVLRVAEG